MSTAFSYIRFSSKEQIQGDSERRQLQATVDYCKKHNLYLSQKSFKDFGISAFKKVTRPSLEEMKTSIDEGVIKEGDYIILESLDRLSREGFTETQSIISSIISRGVKIVALHENITITSTNKDDLVNIIRIALAADLAHQESKKKSERIKAAWENKNRQAREDKKPRTKMIPSWIKLSEDGESFELDKERTQVVNQIFTLFSRGMGRRGIASKLNSEKVAHISSHTRTKGIWHPSFIQKIINNEAVIGTFVPTKLTENGKRVQDPSNKIENYYPKAVPESLFHAVQRIIKSNEQRGGRKGKAMSNILQGTIYCEECGSTMVYKNTNSLKAEFYLHCSKASVKACSNRRLYRYQLIERSIVECVGLENFQLKVKELNNLIRVKESIADVIEDKYREQRQQNEILDALISVPNSTDIAIRIKEIGRNLAKLESEINELKSQQKAITSESDEYVQSLTYEDIVRGTIEERVEYNNYLRNKVKIIFNSSGHVKVILLAPTHSNFKKGRLYTEIKVVGTTAFFRFDVGDEIEFTFIDFRLGETSVKTERLR